VIAGYTVHKSGADNDGTLEISCQMLVGIAKEEGSDMKVNAGFLADTREHLVDGIRGLCCRVDLLTRCCGSDRASIIEKIKGMGVAHIQCPDFVRALDSNKTLGNYGDELTGRAWHLEDAVGMEGETLCLRERFAHPLEKGHGIGIDAGRLGMESRCR